MIFPLIFTGLGLQNRAFRIAVYEGGKIMLYTYTAVITRGIDKCYARVPDIPGCATTGKNVEDAVVQITDALRGCLMVLEARRIPIAPATPQQDIMHSASDILVSIIVDTFR